MKLTHWAGVLATGLGSVTAFSGCSSATPDSPMGTAGSGAGGTATGIQLTPTQSYTVLSGADALPNPTPAPAAWSAAGCVSCHGNNGEGNVIGPEIRHTPVDYATWVVRNGRTFMGKPTSMVAVPPTSTDPTKSAITNADLMAVLAWLDGAPKPTTGQGLYKDFCGNCHGPNMGTGGNIPVNITGKMVAQITQKVRVGEGMDPGMRNGYMPAETTAALTDAELALISTFLGAK
jgi:mono/diheme cytochrome c family protein